ncbi:unnamed protein product [Protopolystoma xenopodis]|uniref:Cation/H+ exchanger domain-containing protein n=1 Tax=Protopolystoma xenopodis TaxID=117903 RepID=A0A3S5CRZ3_9PLAT|nr:unnamed protein product [Protopolystoma xenopodis]
MISEECLGVLTLMIAISFRFLATILAVTPSQLSWRERLFVAVAWLPKATVQAAIGPVALDTARQLQASESILIWGEEVSHD